MNLPATSALRSSVSPLSSSVRLSAPPVNSRRRLSVRLRPWPTPNFHSSRPPASSRWFHWPFRRSSVKLPSPSVRLVS